MANDKDVEMGRKKIVRQMGIEGVDYFSCTHKSHGPETFIVHGSHEDYQKHLAAHGKKVGGAAPCNRCGKEANMDLQNERYGVKPMCQQCQEEMIAIWKAEGRIR